MTSLSEDTTIVPNRINFYSSKQERWGCFSNFSQHRVFFEDRIWKTSEHAYQAQKFISPTVRNRIDGATSPHEAAKMGRDRSVPLRPDWEAIKVSLMYQILREKFTQHDLLRENLISSGKSYISEHTKNDYFWGDGGDDSGKNMLGRLLMVLREELRQ